MSMLDGLISYWALNEASGNALDAHGSNDLTDTNTVGSASGKVGNARDFEAGSSQYFTLADNADLSTGDIDFSMAAWVKLESKSGQRTVVGKWNFNTSNREFLLEYITATDRFRTGLSSTGANQSFHSADTFGAPSLDTWYLLIFWHDSVNNVRGISVNGVEDTTAYSSGVFDSNAPFTMGRIETTNHWDGLIDEVAFAKRVWTPEERAWIYNSGNGRSYADWVATAATGGIVGRGLTHSRKLWRPSLVS
jgi:hypothetical protein